MQVSTAEFRPQSDFLQAMMSRGYLHQCSDLAGLDAKAKAGGLTGYIGFDCTAPSLHVGSMLPIMMLTWLQRTGGRPIALMGGGTSRVGDPSGKDESRQMLTLDAIEANKDGILKVFAKFLAFGESGTDAMMLDNADWLTKLNYIDFLRDVGKHFSVNRMLAMDSVRTRIERDHEMSFIEFNYMCLQSYDFVELHRRTGCVLQMGGSDQWGNIITGLDLGRRMGTAQLYALTTHLLTTASGAKMGKTASGAVWLNADMRSPYEYWQFWRNTEDADVGRFLRLFTFLDLPEIAKLEALDGAEINVAKKTLADEATTLLHGKEAALAAAETARKTFEEGAVGDALPRVAVVRAELVGSGLLSAFVKAGLATSTSEARRQVKGGGLRVNDQALTDDRAIISESDIRDGVVKLSLGRKKHVLLMAT